MFASTARARRANRVERVEIMHKVFVVASMLAGVASCAYAQGLPAGTLMRFQVWNGTQWTNSVTVDAGARFEYRITMSYTGTATNVAGLGSARYQPFFSNAINNGVSIDNHAPFRNGGSSGSAISNSMLSAAEGESGAALADYGRVVFGSTGMVSSSFNVLTQFRHGGGTPSIGAPAGSFIRLAGSAVEQWPRASLPTVADATPGAINQIARGVAASQRRPIENNVPNTSFVQGTQDVIVFRGAMQLANDQIAREMIISNAAGSLLRGVYGEDSVFSANDDRYISWWAADNSAISTTVTVENAQVQIVPGPGALGLLAAAGLMAVRRRH
jgi:hypothetical protein